MKGSGIYKIRNIVNDKLYVGSSCSMQERKTKHIRDLRLNKHHSPKLQNAWNKYGENNFVFEVIKEGIIISNIIKCCKKQGYFRTVGDYVWRYKDDYDVLEIAQSIAYKKVIRKKSKELEQFSLETNEMIKVWSSTKEASLSLKILPKAINNCLLGRSKSAGGFKWRYKIIK